MADDKGDEEPSIEEILSSIRDIISDEDEEGGDSASAGESAEADSELVKDADAPVVDEKPEAAAPEDENIGDDDDDDVLELRDMVEEESPTADSQPVESTNDVSIEDNDPLAGINFDHPTEDDLEVEDGVDEILDMGGDNATDDEIEMVDAPSVDDLEEPAVTSGLSEESPLVDRIAETATVGAMAKLAENIAIARTAQGVTIEDVVRDLLRPMLKGWLDENLPTLIERLVSQELERLADKAARK